MARRRKFALIFAPETIDHMDAIEPKYQKIIERRIDEQLEYVPQRPTRNRKPLDDPGPLGATWELRFGPRNRFRVFYDVNESTWEVNVLAIGVKERDRLFIGGKEYIP
jgi:mRNA-degrading endonuclease RelE of RelBE toxin-antitoxin system